MPVALGTNGLNLQPCWHDCQRARDAAREYPMMTSKSALYVHTVRLEQIPSPLIGERAIAHNSSLNQNCGLGHSRLFHCFRRLFGTCFKSTYMQTLVAAFEMQLYACVEHQPISCVDAPGYIPYLAAAASKAPQAWAVHPSVLKRCDVCQC